MPRKGKPPTRGQIEQISRLCDFSPEEIEKLIEKQQRTKPHTKKERNQR